MAGKSLQGFLYWLLCEAAKVKPELHWKSKHVGEFIVMRHLPRELCTRSKTNLRKKCVTGS